MSVQTLSSLSEGMVLVTGKQHLWLFKPWIICAPALAINGSSRGANLFGLLHNKAMTLHSEAARLIMPQLVHHHPVFYANVPIFDVWNCSTPVSLSCWLTTGDITSTQTCDVNGGHQLSGNHKLTFGKRLFSLVVPYTISTIITALMLILLLIWLIAST